MRLERYGINESAESKSLVRKREVFFWSGLVVICLFLALGFILYSLFFRDVMDLTGAVAYGLDMLGIFASVFVYLGCMSSRKVQVRSSARMARLLFMTDMLFLYDAGFSVFKQFASNVYLLGLLADPLILLLMFMLWRYVSEALTSRKGARSVLWRIVYIAEVLGIAGWTVYFLLVLFLRGRAADGILAFSAQASDFFDILVMVVLLAVNVRVLFSDIGRLQKFCTAAVSLGMILFLTAGFIGYRDEWRLETNVVYGLTVLLISCTVFPERIRFQEIISRAFAIVLLGTVLVYGQLLSANYSRHISELTGQEARELLNLAAKVMRGTTPEDLKEADTEKPALAIMNVAVRLTPFTRVFGEVIDASTGTREDAFLLTSHDEDSGRRGYAHIDLPVILKQGIFPEEEEALAGKTTEKTVLLRTEEETFAFLFSPWPGRNEEVIGVLGVCSFPDRWMVSRLNGFYVRAIVLLIMVMAGALVLAYMVERKLIWGVKLTVERFQRYFAGEEEPEQDSFSRGSYEGFYFTRAFTFILDDLKEQEKRLVEETREKERIRTELELAGAIQLHKMPGQFPPYPDRDEFSIYASIRLAKEIGGDIYDFYFLDPDHLVLLIADVSGKGIPAALFMMTARVILKSAVLECRTPADAFTQVNEQLFGDNEERMFVTAWLGMLELGTGRLVTSNAGHSKMLICRNGVWDYGPAVPGPALGLFSAENSADGHPPDFHDHEVYLKPGDMIFQCTDGVVEAVNEKREFFGKENLMKTLDGLSVSDPDPGALIQGVMGAIDDFRGEAAQFDDIAMLSVVYHGPHQENDTLVIAASDYGSFARVRGKILEVCPDMSAAKHCILVCDEIFHNIVMYAQAQEIRFSCKANGNELEIEFTDDGKPFDTANAVIRQKEFEELQDGGMGLTLIRKLTRELRYVREGGLNVLCAVVDKKQPPGEALN